jgi:hypothetical protein
MMNECPLGSTTDVQEIVFQVQAVIIALGRTAIGKGIMELSKVDTLDG